MSEWLQQEGITDEHRTFATDNKIENVGALFDRAAKPTESNPWNHGISDHHKGFLETKGFKELPAFIDSYQNIEKNIGVPVDRRINLPEKSDDAEGWGKVYNKLGRPETAEGYDISVPEGAEDPNNMVGWAKEHFHKLGLSKVQGEGFITAWNEKIAETNADDGISKQHDALRDEKELRIAWGVNFEKNMGTALGVARKFELTDHIDNLKGAIGSTKTMSILQQIGEAMGEHKFVGGESGNSGNLSPEAAQYQLNQLLKDEEFRDKYAAGDAESVNKINKLTEMTMPR